MGFFRNLFRRNETESPIEDRIKELEDFKGKIHFGFVDFKAEVKNNIKDMNVKLDTLKVNVNTKLEVIELKMEKISQLY